ncbi:MAG: D-alanyl-D-alanine carboxypeptidase/D-alanyl-D-alanine-endopeptidase [Prevotellaceae bacterium]|jgi:D-alanyl-D-alanine carboxypeptidase/D-alanyl-D-alanine-endopeptidase (penicillin-binding protein 4)|nr:D-alanyl-D-alanine carboxypeptidase/D-alanyl-D-alanine-endopeptidase [Prevotellaceae bacterium]
MKKILPYLLFAAFNLSLNAQPAVNSLINAPGLKRANISLLVKDIETGEEIAQYRADKNTVPASTTKLVTTATALEILGKEFRFETRLQYNGEIIDSTLYGNLYIKGSGDPTLGSAFTGNSLFLPQWVQAVKNLGIKCIEGAVIGDASLFDSEGVSPKWSWEDLGNYYASGAYGISIFDNTCRVSFQSGPEGSRPKILRTQPEIPNLQFDNNLKAGKTQSDNAYFYGAPLENYRSIRGRIPANRTEFISKSDIPNPVLYAAQIFTRALTDSAIIVEKEAQALFKPDSFSPRITFYVQQSPPLESIIAEINHQSNNHYAEHLFRYLGLQAATQANRENAVMVEKNYWQKNDLNISGLIVHDGCGLSPSNAISARFLTDLLCYEYRSANREVFIKSLPVAGESGTIKNLLKNTKLQGKVQAKSGSISGVQCYAGYIFWNEKTYAFAVLINNFSGTRKNTVKLIEQYLLSVVK